MNRNGSLRPALLAAVAAVVVCGAFAAWDGVGRSYAAQDGIPANLVPPEGQVLKRELLGIGAQVYACQPSTSAPFGYEWTFTAPAAVLLDDAGTIAGTHFSGPTWLSLDGSRVTGTVLERAPSPDARAVPWLLLRATPGEAAGVFGDVSYIQRLETTGGVAPADGCDEQQVGAVVRVPYTASYLFYGAP